MEEKEDKGAFEFEDTGFHEKPDIPEPPSLKEMGAEEGEVEAVVIEEIPEEVAGSAISGAPEAPKDEKPPEPAPPAPEPEPQPPPAVERRPKPPAAKPPSKPKIPARRPVKAAPKARPSSKRVQPARPAPPAAAEQKPAPAAPKPTPVTAPPSKPSKAPWALALLLLVACGVLGFLFWRKGVDLKEAKSEADRKVAEAKQEAEKKIAAVEKEKDDLQRKVKALEKAKRRLEQEKSDLEAQLRTKEQSVSSLMSQIRELRTQVDSLQALAAKASTLENDLRAKEMMLEAQRKLVKEAEEKRQKMEQQMAKYQDAVVRLTQELKSAQREIERLRKYGAGEAATRFLREKESLMKRIKELEKENARLQNQLASAEASGPASGLRREVKRLRKELAKVTQEKAALRDALLETNARLKRYISPVEALDAWQEAFRSRDIRRLAPLYSQKSDFWKRWTGPEREALEKEFRDAAFEGLSSMKVLSITRKGDEAVAIVVLKTKSGKTYKGRFTLVLEDDRWRIMSEEF